VKTSKFSGSSSVALQREFAAVVLPVRETLELHQRRGVHDHVHVALHFQVIDHELKVLLDQFPVQRFGVLVHAHSAALGAVAAQPLLDGGWDVIAREVQVAVDHGHQALRVKVGQRGHEVSGKGVAIHEVAFTVVGVDVEAEQRGVVLLGEVKEALEARPREAPRLVPLHALAEGVGVDRAFQQVLRVVLVGGVQHLDREHDFAAAF
jgi:hypothetical protein